MGKLLAGGVIVDNRDRVMLWRRNTGDKKQWELPGKIVDSHETLEEAVVEGIEKRLGVDAIWVGEIVCTARFTDGEDEFKAELLSAKIVDDDPIAPQTAAVDRVDFFAFNALEDLQRQGKLSPSVEHLMHLVYRYDLTLGDFTP
ncbi:MAG: hydrolase [Candidatus Saccharibacteria bacterium]|nr:hydrolase [Candidatus Saccharibacteria bacterium]